MQGGHRRRALAGGPGPLKLRPRQRAALVIVSLGLLVGTGGIPAIAEGPVRGVPGRASGAPDSYYRPVLVDGMTFPVARAPWLSVIELADDWHAPRFRLVDGRWRLVGYHEGNDIMAEEGTPVVAMLGGTVERIGWTFYSGTRVGIRGTDGRYYLYAHLSEVAPGIVDGASVRSGEALGRVGNTGYGPPGHRDEFPPHLHLGIQEGGAWVNPFPAVRRLYEASVRATSRAEDRLGRLERAGRTEGWERAAARLYADR